MSDVPAFLCNGKFRWNLLSRKRLFQTDNVKKGIEKRRMENDKNRQVCTDGSGRNVTWLIPVTEEIIRCVIGKEEIKGNDSLIIEKKGISGS